MADIGKSLNKLFFGALATTVIGIIVYLYGLTQDDSGLDGAVPMFIGGPLLIAGLCGVSYCTWRLRCAEIVNRPDAAEVIKRAKKVGVLTSLGALFVYGTVLATIIKFGHHHTITAHTMIKQTPALIPIIMFGFMAATTLVTKNGAGSKPENSDK